VTRSKPGTRARVKNYALAEDIQQEAGSAQLFLEACNCAWRRWKHLPRAIRCCLMFPWSRQLSRSRGWWRSSRWMNSIFFFGGGDEVRNSNFSFFPQTGTELQHLVLTLGTHNNNNTYLKQHSMHNQREKGRDKKQNGNEFKNWHQLVRH